MEQYNSGEDAFNSLNIGIRFEKVHVKRVLRKIADILKIPKDEYEDFKAMDALAFKLHNNTRGFKFLDKSLKIGMTSNRSVVFFADVYDDNNMMRDVRKKIVDIGNNIGIDIEMFEKSYGGPLLGDQKENAFIIPENTKYYNSGYRRLYRGHLFGLIVHS